MTNTIPRPGGGTSCTPVRRLWLHVDHLLATAAALRNRRRLGELPDHLLKDLGLTHEEAVGEASRPIWNAPPQWRLPGS
jgi:uncharacterized protein YjiS (DUF1127 family)